MGLFENQRTRTQLLIVKAKTAQIIRMQNSKYQLQENAHTSL